MAMKKTTKPTPPNPNKMKVSSALTVLGGVTGSFKDGTLKRKPLTDAQMKNLKAIIAANEAAKKPVNPKAVKKEAKLIKDANKNSAKKAAKGAALAKKNEWSPPARSKIEGFRGGTSRGLGGGGLGGGSVTQRPR